MEWHASTEKQVLEDLNTSREGLSHKEASARLEHYGLNELIVEKSPHPLILLLQQFRSFLVAILIIATVFSFAIGESLDGTVILIIIILNALFGFVQEYKASKAIQALKKLTSPESLVLRDRKKQKIPSRELVPGDMVFLEEGTKIPADLRLLEAANLRIDEASLTGESAPVTKHTGLFRSAVLAERKNMAYAGTHATYGHGFGVVTTTGMATEIGKIAHVVGTAKHERTPLQKRLATFSKRLGLLIMIISIAVIVGGVLRSYPVNDMILTGIALAVAAIPEGLPAVVTITLALGLQRLSKKNALMRRLPAVETLGSTSIICSDKTGTLTKNEMTVKKIWIPSKLIEVSGQGYSPEGHFLINGKKVTPPNILLRIATLCNNATLKKNSILGDPTEGALLVAAAKSNAKYIQERVHEIPFSSERKMMSTVNIVVGKRVLHTKGAPEVVLQKCSRILLNGRVVELTTKKRQEILRANLTLSNQALRVLGFAFKPVNGKPTENNLIFVGLMGLIDPPRESVKEDIKTCRRSGIKTIMITGDHKNTALAIAQTIGLYSEGDQVLTGEELEKLSPASFASMVENVTVYARVNPSHKVRIVEALKRKGHVVAMTGDGVNDAPALKKADIGIAMGIKGTDVAKEASEMILTDDHFSSIVSAVREGRGIYENITKFIRYLLSSNIAEVLVIALALLLFSSTGEPLIPLLAVQILWINLITDGLPALALGVDPTLPGIMNRKPRPLTEKLLSRQALTFVFTIGFIITVGVLWVFTSQLENGLEKAQTMAFTTLVVAELFNVFNVRSFLQKNGLPLGSNRKLLLAVVSSFILQLVVVYVPPVQEAFSTVPLLLEDWITIFAVGIAVLVIWTVKGRLSH